MDWRKIWTDPVWSKVIAGLILTIFGSTAVAAWSRTESIGKFLTAPMELPVWVGLLQTVCFLGLLFSKSHVPPNQDE